MSAIEDINPHRKGECTEAVVIAELRKRGIPVAIPFGDNERYDPVAESEEQLYKIQVETGNLKDGLVIFRGSSQHTNSQGNIRKQYEGDIDFFIVYCHELDSMYLVSESAVGEQMRLRVEEPQQEHRTINWAEDYAFDANWPPESTPRPSGRDGQRVVERLREHGVPVARIVVDDRPYDLLVGAPDGRWYRTTVRPGYLVDGRVRFDTGHTTGPDPGETDLVPVDCRATDVLYVVRRDEYDSTISFRVADPDEAHTDTKWAEEYRFGTRWPSVTRTEAPA